MCLSYLLAEEYDQGYMTPVLSYSRGSSSTRAQRCAGAGGSLRLRWLATRTSKHDVREDSSFNSYSSIELKICFISEQTTRARATTPTPTQAFFLSYSLIENLRAFLLYSFCAFCPSLMCSGLDLCVGSPCVDWGYAGSGIFTTSGCFSVGRGVHPGGMVW